MIQMTKGFLRFPPYDISPAGKPCSRLSRIRIAGDIRHRSSGRQGSTAGSLQCAARFLNDGLLRPPIPGEYWLRTDLPLGFVPKYESGLRGNLECDAAGTARAQLCRTGRLG